MPVVETNGHPPRSGQAEYALSRHGFDGERLMRLARKVANDYLRSRGATLPHHRFEDMVSFLVLQGIRAAIRYDPDRKHGRYGMNGGDPFASYLADVMEQRCVDYYRSKAEGFGDKRYGNNDRVLLSAMEDDPDPDIDFDRMISDRAAARWQRAATVSGMSLVDFIVVHVDRAASSVLKDAA